MFSWLGWRVGFGGEGERVYISWKGGYVGLLYGLGTLGDWYAGMYVWTV